MPEMTQGTRGFVHDRRLLTVAAELFLLHSLLLALALVAAGTVVPQFHAGRFFYAFQSPFLHGLRNWDGGWYLQIARQGYASRLAIVFFPLFPLLIRGVADLLHIGLLPAGLLIANLSFFLAIYLFLLLLRGEGYPEKTARRAALFLIVFPTAFFFGAVYTEPLFLVLSLGAFLCARRGQWLGACLLAGLTALARNPGILLLPVLGWEYLRQERKRGRLWDRRVLYLALIPLMFGTFLLYQKIWFGDPLAFVHNDTIPAWSRLATVTGRPIILDLRILIPPHFVSWWTINFDDFAFTMFALAVLVAGIRLVRSSYWLYAAASFLMPLSTYIKSEPLTSMPRYIIVLFPLFMILARKVTKPRTQLFVTVLFAGLFILMGALYIDCYWVA